jgi:transcriptional regulator with XRE-family HTH domain
MECSVRLPEVSKNNKGETSQDRTAERIIDAWLKQFASVVKDARENKKLKQEALDVVSRKSLSDIENHNTDWQIRTFLRILIALDIDVWKFFGGVERNAPRWRIDQQVVHDMIDEIWSSNREDLTISVIKTVEGLHSQLRRS